MLQPETTGVPCLCPSLTLCVCVCVCHSLREDKSERSCCTSCALITLLRSTAAAAAAAAVQLQYQCLTVPQGLSRLAAALLTQRKGYRRPVIKSALPLQAHQQTHAHSACHQSPVSLSSFLVEARDRGSARGTHTHKSLISGTALQQV